MTETLVPVLVGGVIAAVASFGGQWFAHWLGVRKETRALAGAFAGEIGALCAIARRRRYLEGAKDLLAHVQATGEVHRLALPITAESMTVFHTNATSIGHLPPHLVADVVRFYTQAKSMLEDVRADGRDPRNPEEAEHMLRELVSLLEDTLTIGDSVVRQLLVEAGTKPSTTAR